MINQNIYIINFTTLINWLLPVFLRKPIQIAWVKCFVLPFENLHTKKQLFRTDIRYKLAHNGRTIYLEKVLNEYYSIVGYDHQDHQNTKHIYIGAGEELFPKYIFQDDEEKPLYVFTEAENAPVFIYADSEITYEFADFIVYVPNSLSYIEAELRAVIDYYLDTKIYKIKTY